MTLKQQKLDITDRVVGKFENGDLVLYLENERIGTMSLPSERNIKLEEHHLECSGDKIYQKFSTPTAVDPKFTDCDEGGWC